MVIVQVGSTSRPTRLKKGDIVARVKRPYAKSINNPIVDQTGRKNKK